VRDGLVVCTLRECFVGIESEALSCPRCAANAVMVWQYSRTVATYCNDKCSCLQSLFACKSHWIRAMHRRPSTMVINK